MSGESQRSLDRNQLLTNLRASLPSPHGGLEAGEMGLPSSTTWSLSGLGDDELRRGLQIDRALTDTMRAPPLPSGLMGRLHRLVDQLAAAP